MKESLVELAEQGYTLLPAAFGGDEIQTLIQELVRSFENENGPSLLKSRGRIYGSRNLMDTFRAVCEIPQRPVIREFLSSVMGPQTGLVRALYFDKPPDRSWSLPWHRDRTIAVKRNDLPSGKFRNPTVKAGIPHVEAPDSLLTEMLTIRVHLDPMTIENGPLSVIPGSHKNTESTAEPKMVLADAGDVFVMRPLLSHSSSNSREGTTLHRRVIHLELSPIDTLPDGFQWHHFRPIS